MKIIRLISMAAGVAVLSSVLALTGCSSDENVQYVSMYTTDGGNPVGKIIYTQTASGLSITDFTTAEMGVIIPDEIDGEEVVEIADSAFSSNGELVVAVIPDGVTSVGKSAFISMKKVYCSNPDKVTCDSTSFASGVSLSSGFNDDGSIYFCQGEYKYKELETGGIAITGFEPNIIAEIPEELGNVTSIGDYAFNGADEIDGFVDFPATVVKIGSHAFYNCTSLSHITVNGSAAEEGTADLAAVTELGDWAFGGCEKLTTVKLSDSLKTIGDGTFSRCDRISEVVIPASVESIGTYAFDNCSSLQNISISEGNKRYCDIDGVLFNRNATEILKFPEGRSEDYTIPNSVRVIGVTAFRNLDSRITISKKVSRIETRAFMGSSSDSLRNMAIPFCEMDTPILSDSLTTDFNESPKMSELVH